MQSFKLEEHTSENHNKQQENYNSHQNNQERQKDPFIIQNKIIFKKYKPIKQIGHGTFSTVYLASVVDSNKYVAIKAEKKSQNSVELLKTEAFVLYSLRGYGIPEVLSFGKTKYYNILVMPLLGKSLLDMFIIRSSPINKDDICISSIQILDRIEWVHSNNIVYRDIKPENFLFGKSDNNVLYLIDFGLCRKYRSAKTGKHISPKNLGKFTGTSRYASVYAMAGNEQSRRDDIESIGYMIIFFMKKKLPWQGIKGNSYKECYHKLFLMKKHMELEILCRGLPNEMLEYMKYAKAMKFEEEPNYKYLKNLFKAILNKNKISIDKYVLSWCRKDYNNIDNIEKNGKNNNKEINNKKINNNNTQQRKSSPSHKVYKKVKDNLDSKVKSNDYSNLNINNIIQNIATLNKTSPLNKNELNSEVSNTLKVIMSKNLQSLGGGQNQSAGINLNLGRINSEKNIYSDNFFILGNNNTLKGYTPHNYKVGQLMSFNQQVTDRNNYNKIDSSQNYPNFSSIKNDINEVNKIRKITSMSSKPNNSSNNINNNIFININNNKNKYNKITHIKIENMNQENRNNYSNIRNNNHKESNIIYNTYNTYNTYNSYNNINNISSPMNNNNVYINSIYKRDPPKIINYQNYNNIKKTNFQNRDLLNYIKSESFIKNNEKKSYKDIPKNINYISNKYTSIDNNKKKDSITSHFQYKNYRNQNDLNSYSNLNDIRKSNTGLNKNKIVSITQMNKDKIQNKNNINKIQHYNSYVITNKDNYKYNNNISYNEPNRGKNNFIKITKHSNKNSLQNINLKKNINIENRSVNITNSNKINKSFQYNQKNTNTLENNNTHYINNRYAGNSKVTYTNSYNTNKNRLEINLSQNQKNYKNLIHIDNKDKKNNKIIYNQMQSPQPNHSLKIVRTSSKKNFKSQDNLVHKNNDTNKISRINKYKIVRNKNVQNH